jgi:hypothetical protein
MLVLPTVMVTLFLFIYRYVFGGAIATGGAVDYVHYLVPGFLVTTILWTGMNAPAGVAQDAASGVHDRLRSLPIPRGAVTAGRSFADTALGCWTLVTTTALGVAVGFRAQGGAGRVLLAGAVLLAATYTFSWVFIALGLMASNAQAAQGMASVVVVPFTFMSSVRAHRLHARLDAGRGLQPARHRRHQRRPQPLARRHRRHRHRPQHHLLGHARPRVVRGAGPPPTPPPKTLRRPDGAGPRVCPGSAPRAAAPSARGGGVGVGAVNPRLDRPPYVASRGRGVA